MGAASPQEWDPYGEASLPSLFRWALPRRVGVGRPPSFQMVGSARRSGPKLQARSAVSGRWGRLRRESGTPRRGVPTFLFSMGAAAPSARWASPVVPNGRVGSPQRTQTSGAKRRFWGMGAASPQEWDPCGEASLPSFFDGRCRAMREKRGERPSLACEMQSLFHQARPFMAMAWKPHRCRSTRSRGAPRVRLVGKSTGLRPHFFRHSPPHSMAGHQPQFPIFRQGAVLADEDEFLPNRRPDEHAIEGILVPGDKG